MELTYVMVRINGVTKYKLPKLNHEEKKRERFLERLKSLFTNKKAA
jgi:hypothetical protein